MNTSVTGITNLTRAQSKDIWTGNVRNWKEVGGPDLPIVLVIRPPTSGTRATFRKTVLDGASEAQGLALTEDSNGTVATAVKQTSGTISVLAFAYVVTSGQGLVTLQYEGVEPSVGNLESGSYQIFSFGHVYTHGPASGLAQAFIDFMLSPEIQSGPVNDLDYAPVRRAER